jgi:2-polyprenyl-3-methyl-5-hydroxy-6-metoxy-1,4-benzoquinol methylase
MTAESPAGNVYNKYETRNPIARWLMAGFDRSMFELLEELGPVSTILEVGCGEGFVARKLADRFSDAEILATDVSREVIEEARSHHPDLRFEVCSAYDLGSLGRQFDLVVAAEVLEHLEDPGRALRSIGGAAREWIFLSVPREPLWRVLNLARGKYVRDLGNTPGHVQHWSAGGFIEFLGGTLEVKKQGSPLPWTQALCRPRS